MRRTIRVVLALLVMFALVRTLQAVDRYRLVDLGTFGGSDGYASDLNNGGQVVGTATTASGEYHAFLWQDGVLSDLGVPAGSFDSVARGINDSGMICGHSGSPGQYRAWALVGGVPTDLDTLGGSEAVARDISNAGVMVGLSRLPGGTWNSAYWDNGTIHNLGTGFGSAGGVSPGGLVTGQFGSASHVYIWDNGLVTDLGNAGLSGAIGGDINDSRQVAGYGSFNGQDRGLYYDGTGTLEIVAPLPGGASARLGGINAAGTAVGSSAVASGQRHATLYANGQLIDLDPNVYAPGYVVTNALAINDRGQIAGAATLDGERHPVLLLPNLVGISASYLTTSFNAKGGDLGIGELLLNDAADITAEIGFDQLTWEDCSFMLKTSLVSDQSTGGMARGVFAGGMLSIMGDDDNAMLTADLLDLVLQEPGNVASMLAGTGSFLVTGGSLAQDFGPMGDVVQITFRLSPGGINDFSASFTGITDLSLTPVPEPATVLLLGTGLLGALGVFRRRRMSK